MAFGQPSRSLTLSLVTSVCGYSLFWLTLTQVHSRRHRFWQGCLWFAGVQAIQLSWMTATTYHGVYILLVYLGVLIGLGAQFGLLTAFFPMHMRPAFPQSLALASLWTLMEWSRLFFLCGFPFNMSGIALSAFIVPAQLVAIVGVLGLSFSVMLINLCVLRFLRDHKPGSLGICIGLIALVYGFGWIHLSDHMRKMEQAGDIYQVALVQTGLRPEERAPLSGKTDALISPFEQWMRILLYLEEHKRARWDLIVLPETAVPYGAHQKLYQIEEVRQILEETWGDSDENILSPAEGVQKVVSNAFWAQAIANHYHSEVIIGLDDYDPSRDESYNAAFHFFPQERSGHRYEKCILVPLAEYLPIKFLAPLARKYGFFTFATHGKGAKVFGKKVATAISICYEECFGHFMRQGRLQGAQLFVNVTNDGWFLPSILPEQHFYHARLRAIENGVPLLRACNTGITAAIDSLGREQARLPNMKEDALHRGALTAAIPLYHYSTLYTRYGDAPVITLCALQLMVFVGVRRFLWKRLTIRS